MASTVYNLLRPLRRKDTTSQGAQAARAILKLPPAATGAPQGTQPDTRVHQLTKCRVALQGTDNPPSPSPTPRAQSKWSHAVPAEREARHLPACSQLPAMQNPASARAAAAAPTQPAGATAHK